MVISVYDTASTINISADEAELVRHALVCSGDEQSSGGASKSFPSQRGEEIHTILPLQLKVSQSLDCGDAQRNDYTTWSFQGAYGSHKDHSVRERPWHSITG